MILWDVPLIIIIFLIIRRDVVVLKNVAALIFMNLILNKLFFNNYLKKTVPGKSAVLLDLI